MLVDESLWLINNQDDFIKLENILFKKPIKTIEKLGTNF